MVGAESASTGTISMVRGRPKLTDRSYFMDFVFIGLIVGFFALSAGLATLCEKL